jgi:alcohol dehydrogenase
LALYGGVVEAAGDAHQAASALADALHDYLRLAGLPRRLAAWNVGQSELAPLAEEAARQWTAGFNPRPVRAEDFVRLYRSVWHNGESS